jgi:hypothetical protein
LRYIHIFGALAAIKHQPKKDAKIIAPSSTPGIYIGDDRHPLSGASSNTYRIYVWEKGARRGELRHDVNVTVHNDLTASLILRSALPRPVLARFYWTADSTIGTELLTGPAHAPVVSPVVAPSPDAAVECDTDIDESDPRRAPEPQSRSGVSSSGIITVASLGSYDQLVTVHCIDVTFDSVKDMDTAVACVTLKRGTVLTKRVWHLARDILIGCNNLTSAWQIVNRFVNKQNLEHKICWHQIHHTETNPRTGKKTSYRPLVTAASPDLTKFSVVYTTGETASFDDVPPADLLDFRVSALSTTPYLEVPHGPKLTPEPLRTIVHRVDAAAAAERIFVPEHWKHVSRSAEDPWYIATIKELIAVHRTGCGRLVCASELDPDEYVVLNSRMVYKYKPFDPIPEKARITVRGDQQPASSYDDTHASSPELYLLRLILAVEVMQRARGEKVHSFHYDVSCAFPNSILKEKIAMRLPPGMSRAFFGEDLIYLLYKSLYGLKQSARNWELMVTRIMKALGFSASDIALCLWVKHVPPSSWALVLVQTDDFAGCANDRTITDGLLAALRSEVIVKDLGENDVFLNLQITRNLAANTVNLSAPVSIMHHLRDLGLSEIRERSAPTSCNFDFAKAAADDSLLCPRDVTRYMSIGGVALWFARAAAPSISRTVGNLLRYGTAPTVPLMGAAEHLMGYLKAIRFDGITFSEVPQNPTSDILLALGPTYNCLYAPVGIADGSWGSAGVDASGRSTSSSLVMLANGPVIFDSRLEPTVATSVAQSELKSINNTCGNTLFIERVLTEICIPRGPRGSGDASSAQPRPTPSPVTVTSTLPAAPHIDEVPAPDVDSLLMLPRPVYSDSTSAIHFVEGIPVSRKLRHVAISQAKAREYKNSGVIDMMRVPGTLNPADIGATQRSARRHRVAHDFITNMLPANIENDNDEPTGRPALDA